MGQGFGNILDRVDTLTFPKQYTSFLKCLETLCNLDLVPLHLVTTCDLVTVFAETKSVTKSRLHCIHVLLDNHTRVREGIVKFNFLQCTLGT